MKRSKVEYHAALADAFLRALRFRYSPVVVGSDRVAAVAVTRLIRTRARRHV